MKQIVAVKPISETISIAQIVESKEYFNGIVVQIYRNRVSFLCENPSIYALESHKVGFRRIGFEADAHSCSENVADTLGKSSSSEVKTFQFESLREFAQAVIDNGWEMQ
jgi:hypothetical protein